MATPEELAAHEAVLDVYEKSKFAKGAKQLFRTLVE